MSSCGFFSCESKTKGAVNVISSETEVKPVKKSEARHKRQKQTGVSVPSVPQSDTRSHYPAGNGGSDGGGGTQ